ncbi:hcf136, partial [Symbiodinium microadriaticum]
MPTPSIPSNDVDGNWNPDDITSQASSEVIKSILIDVPVAGPEADALAVLRDQFQSEVQAILARLQAVETHLGMSVPPRGGENNLCHDEDTPSALKKTWVQMPHDETIDNDVLTQTSRLEEKSTPVRFEESYLVCSMRFFEVLLNFAMQVAFSGVLLSDSFMGDSFDTKVGSAKTWRTRVAHDDAYLDLGGTSLVSRVCAGDGALILSTQQATLIEEINKFLALGKDDLEPPVFQIGVMLCVLCILLWSLCVYKEIRRVWLSLEATLQIPKARRTVLKNQKITSISCGRYAMLLVTYLARASIASVLLVAGILWLARTTSIEELMLNAVALNAILDVDEFLFAGMTPIKVQHAVQSLEPIHVRYSRRRSQCETLVHVSLILTTVLLSETMQTVKNELCGGNRTFVVSYNRETQEIIGLTTRLPAEEGESNLTAIELAVRSHIGNSPETTPGPVPDYITFSVNRRVFGADAERSMLEKARQFPLCMETLVLNEGALLHNDPALQPLVDVLLRTAGLALGREMVSSCQELSDFCDHADAGLLRLVCGETCGCTDPVSNPWYKVEAQGCSTSCLIEANWNGRDIPCVDSEANRSWEMFWDSYPDAVSAFYGQPIQRSALWPDLNRTMHGMLSEGCSYLRIAPFDSPTSAHFCEGLTTLFKPLTTICPVTWVSLTLMAQKKRVVLPRGQQTIERAPSGLGWTASVGVLACALAGLALRSKRSSGPRTQALANSALDLTPVPEELEAPEQPCEIEVVDVAPSRAQLVRGSAAGLALANLCAAEAAVAPEWVQYDLNTGETLYDVDFDENDPNHGFIVGARALFYETRDGGQRWVSRSFANLGKGEDISYRFQTVSLNGDEVWIVGKPPLLLHSKDSGKSWKKVPISKKLPGEPKVIVALGPGKAEMATSSGAIYVTENDGKNWKSQVSETIDATLNRVSQSGVSGGSYFTGSVKSIKRNSKGEYLAIAQRGNFYLSFVPGDTRWVPHNRISARRIQGMGFRETANGEQLDGAWMSLNGGVVTVCDKNTFTDLASDTKELFQLAKIRSGGIGIIDVGYRTPNECWATGGSGVIYTSKDG